MDAARYQSMARRGLGSILRSRRRPGPLRGPGHEHRDDVNEISVERRNATVGTKGAPRKRWSAGSLTCRF